MRCNGETRGGERGRGGGVGRGGSRGRRDAYHFITFHPPSERATPPGFSPRVGGSFPLRIAPLRAGPLPGASPSLPGGLPHLAPLLSHLSPGAGREKRKPSNVSLETLEYGNVERYKSGNYALLDCSVLHCSLSIKDRII